MADSCKVTVHAGAHARAMCPVSVLIPWSYDETGNVQLRDSRTRKDVPCQVTRCREGVMLTWLTNGLKVGETRRLVAIPLKGVKSQPVVMLDDFKQAGRVDVTVMGKPFTSYHYSNEWVRPFLHPVLGPGGVAVTRAWPVRDNVKGETRDHPHHKSVWVAYGECGKVDNWSEEKGHGFQRHQSFLRKVSGPVYGQLVAKNHWCTNKGRKQFEEVRDLRFYALRGGIRLVDVAVTFRMTEGEVTFRDTKEGGLLSVRVASSMDVPRGGKIENGYGGVNEDETWGKSAPWCDYSGTVDGVHVGIAIMDHDTNPRYPTGWHVRNYGLMTANCFAWSYYRPEAKVKGDMTFRKGSATTWRYRVYVHRGDARQGKVSERFIDFIAPPKVTVG